jgi:hypothetical protein
MCSAFQVRAPMQLTDGPKPSASAPPDRLATAAPHRSASGRRRCRCWRKDGALITGHGQVGVAAKLGLKSIPVRGSRLSEDENPGLKRATTSRRRGKVGPPQLGSMASRSSPMAFRNYSRSRPACHPADRSQQKRQAGSASPIRHPARVLLLSLKLCILYIEKIYR